MLKFRLMPRSDENSLRSRARRRYRAVRSVVYGLSVRNFFPVKLWSHAQVVSQDKLRVTGFFARLPSGHRDVILPARNTYSVTKIFS